MIGWVLHWPARLAFVLIPALVAVCTNSHADEPRQTLHLLSSTSTAALGHSLQKAERENLRLNISNRALSGEAALQKLAASQGDAALIARPLDAREKQRFQATPLAQDKLLLIVNARNRLERVDTTLTSKIFSRFFSDWSQVNAGDSGVIVPVTRRETQGMRLFFDQQFGIGRVIPTGMVELASDLAVVLYIAADPQAIGYTSAESFAEGRRRGLQIRALELDGIHPEAIDCRQANYPLCRTISLVRRVGTPPEGFEQLKHYLLAGEGQTLLKMHGFSSLAPQ
ncbi:MAG: substrate-binding domain-containing protein [Zoogloeaceae bacterium]|nr:substrate-binding domain-containing protein [Zoogloeaceae bacterium]